MKMFMCGKGLIAATLMAVMLGASVTQANQDSAQVEQTTISVKAATADQDIRQRIEQILNASGWFENLEVVTNSGIVTLSGTTTHSQHKDWAEGIADRTEAVIAVVNKIEVVNRDPWSLTPLTEQTQHLIRGGLRLLPTFFISLLIFLASFFAAKRIAALTRRLLQHRVDSTMLRNLIGRLVAFPALVIGVYLVFSVSGLGNLATTLIGGTGLLGLIIGIAFRDITENFLASILLSIQRPFVLGDMIQVLEYTGMVEAMTTRGTVLMTLDGNHVQIPNTTIYKQPITNLTANPNIRQSFAVGIGYDNSISRVQQLILDLLSQHQAVLDDPEPLILADELAASTVNLKVYFWVDSSSLSFVKVRSSVIRKVKAKLMQEGVSMPDDAREIIFPEGIRLVSEKNEELSPPTSSELEHRTIKKPPSQDESEASLATEAEGDLVSEKGQLEQQAKNGILGDIKTNLLER